MGRPGEAEAKMMIGELRRRGDAKEGCRNECRQILPSVNFIKSESALRRTLLFGIVTSPQRQGSELRRTM